MTPRVLFLDQSGAMGGAEWSLLDLARHFAPSGSAVMLLSDGPFRERLQRQGVPVVVAPAAVAVRAVRRDASPLRALAALPAIAGLVRAVARRARAFDVLYANTQKAFIVAALASVAATRPLVWHLRDILSHEHFSPWLVRLAVAAARLSRARVLANSEATARAFCSRGGAAGRVAVVHNGLDPAPYDPLPEAGRQALRSSLGLGDAPTVGAFSRLSTWKGQDVLLRALPRLPGVHALLVGGALFDEGGFADRLRHDSERLGIADRVHFLGHREDVALLMQAVDAVVHPSTAPEPFGRVLVEAMLSGRAVVASAAGGVPEIVVHGESGWLVPPGDAGALADAVASLLCDRDRTQRMGQAGRARALERFSLDAMLRRITEELEGMSR